MNRYIITLTGSCNVHCTIESPLEAHEAFMLFLRRHYPCKLEERESGNPDEYEKYLVDRLTGKAMYGEGDLRAFTAIGYIGIQELSPSPLKPAYVQLNSELITPQKFQAIAAEAWNKKEREHIAEMRSNMPDNYHNNHLPELFK